MSERLDPQRRGLGGKADSDHVRRQNRSLVLSALRRREPIARVDLGQETRLSPATITAITADLIAEGLIEARSDEGPDAPPREPVRRGRPRVLLRLDASAGYVLAVKIAFNSLMLQIADFSGTIVARLEPDVATFEESRDGFPLKLAGLIGEFVRSAGLDIGQIAEIAIGAQGFVDTVRGSVMWSPAFHERDMRLVEPLEAALGRPCIISNDANMIAQALHEANPEDYSGTFAVVYVGQGVGAGLFVADRLHHGAAGSAAEFGHMNHVVGGPLCRCGRRGCIEAFASDYAVYRAFRNVPGDEAPGGIRPTTADLMAVETAAAGGDERARRIYERVGEALGYGAARLMALINPSRIVFTGSSMRAFPLFETAMRAAIDAALVEDLSRYTVIETLPWQDDMIMKGLTSYMLTRLDREVFSNPVEARRFRV
jgi:predicted NBD/HSP70 family sugar kinase